MRALLQRVKEAQVEVEGKRVGQIGPGLLVFIGFHYQDTPKQIPWMVSKILTLRVFSDTIGKMNLSVQDCGGALLVVSQFTLYGDCHGGRRPSFTEASAGEEAKALYEQFVLEARRQHPSLQTGIFGADMAVSLVNDGPVTFLIEDK